MWWPGLYFIMLIAALMGFTAQPLWVIPLLGVSLVARRVKYCGTQPLTSGPRIVGFLSFMWAVDSLTRWRLLRDWSRSQVAHRLEF